MNAKALICILFAATCQAATVYQTNLVSLSGAPLTGQILFKSLRTVPTVTAPWLADTGLVYANATNGVVNQALTAGNYNVIFPDSPGAFTIAVPEGAGTYTLEAILVTALPTATPANVGVPSGGTTGQVLAKASTNSFDVEWLTAAGLGDMLQSVYDTNANGVVDAVDGGGGSGIDTNNVPALTVGVLTATTVNIGVSNVVSAIASKADLSHNHTGVYQPADTDLDAWALLATSTKQDSDADLTDLADGSLTGSKVGSGIDDDNVSFDDADNLWTATTVGSALEELNDSINAGLPNSATAKVHWSQLLGVPAGFADNSDDGAGGGGDSVTVDSAATVDPNLDDGGDINFTYLAPNITATVKADTVALSTDTTGDYVATITGTANEITVSGTGTEGRAVTVSLPSALALGTASVTGLTNSGVFMLSAATATKLAVFDGSSYLTNSLLTEASITDNLTEAEASVLYQGTNANLTLLQAYGPTTWQATNSMLTTIAGSGAVDWGGFTSFEIPNSDDPDIDAAGEISWDTDGWLRAYDGANQVAVARKIVQIDATVYKPQDLDDAQRDALWIWSNQSGMSFVVTGWYAISSSDDTDLNIEEVDADGQNNATVDAVTIATNGTGLFYGSDTTITAATIETGHVLVLDFDDTDAPGLVKITIYGYYNADVN